jgi:chromosome segregation and condensation protein ScpB
MVEVSWPGKREKLFVTTLQFLKDFSLNSIFDMPDFETMQDKMEQLYALA